MSADHAIARFAHTGDDAEGDPIISLELIEIIGNVKASCEGKRCKLQHTLALRRF